ncbi:uncharacterized protein LOC132923757 [Rhopalosiphum padi]|uniref:uncharacterized protein LOC132923757 n=1 Tax=Rhopalosiphum padi TaxID=40932 RepID=UPI00298E54AD|nr:uncharacterized protein LOC132923757 [Rhopalosiphum padi]
MSSQVRCDDTINLTPNTNHKKIKLTSSSITSVSPTIKENEDNENSLVKQLKDFQKSVNRQLIVQKHETKNIQDRLDIIINTQEKIFEKLCDQTTYVLMMSIYVKMIQ